MLGSLERQRATLAWKCGGLDPAGLRATTAASTITLGGLLKHLAYVEDSWFSESLHGRDRQHPWDTAESFGFEAGGDDGAPGIAVRMASARESNLQCLAA